MDASDNPVSQQEGVYLPSMQQGHLAYLDRHLGTSKPQEGILSAIHRQGIHQSPP